MKHKAKVAKDAWESELGYDWSRSAERRCRARGPESTLSVASDIRFTRRKLTRPCRGCCAALAALLVLMLLAAVAVYLAHMYLFGDPLSRQTFRGSFVAGGAGAGDEAGDGEGDGGGGAGLRGNSTREGELRQALFELYRSSELRSCFVAADVLALDSAESGAGVRVHFELVFEPIFTAVGAAEVAAVLRRALAGGGGGGGGGGWGGEGLWGGGAAVTLAGDADTLHVEETSMISTQPLEEPDSTTADAPSTEAATAAQREEARECAPLRLTLCSHLAHNLTAYPNLVGHAGAAQLQRDLVAFRELLDAECSRLAQDFVCQMLQPRCAEARVVPPCRAYCRAFHAGCGARLPDRLRAHFDCSRFPDYFGPGSCVPEPDCPASLERAALSRRACDGLPDCADAADERGCAHCAGGALRCALHPRCLPRHLRCDGTPDCPDGSDEAGCLWLAQSLRSWRRETAEATLGAARRRGGVAVWRERGASGKLCARGLDRRAADAVAASLCRALTYKNAVSAEVVNDTEAEGDAGDGAGDGAGDAAGDAAGDGETQYVQVADPFAPEIAFVKTDCRERKVLKVTCDELECGLPSARGAEAGAGVARLPRSARPGDWPWHAALLRAHAHVCDAALVHPAWLLTTASCFQGQAKAEWTARLGSVRVSSTSPWQQERRVVGMLRSPVEGSSLALLRLEEPVQTTDFVRPVCLPEPGAPAAPRGVCNSLGWTRHRDQLQRIHLVPSPMGSCENASIATANGLCAEPLYDQDDCDEEEYAGSSMMCFDEARSRWWLRGLSAWRIACTKIGLGRPRIYDDVGAHVDWVSRTIADGA